MGGYMLRNLKNIYFAKVKKAVLNPIYVVRSKPIKISEVFEIKKCVKNYLIYAFYQLKYIYEKAKPIVKLGRKVTDLSATCFHFSFDSV